ncbi:hypothetical protein MVG78_09150 [Roseomonas gilardii subsp. gilardii]|uniref:DUF6976 family protein n=1 Tax=Roseomonas gilardii TaxID=257708 RepID=UPI001FFBA063|nr:hypothetical protein [Roseomonas gilardii]UPG74265.1 hypothetical protein MVG78_09150 [Roseomonas gilardii subsp. gilardii]
MIVTPQEARRLIESGRPLLLTGAAGLLRDLPHGRWIGAGGDAHGDTGGDQLLTCLLPPPAREIRITRLPPGDAAGMARLGSGRGWLLTPGDRLARRLGQRPVWRAGARRAGDLILDGRCGMAHAGGALALTLRD